MNLTNMPTINKEFEKHRLLIISNNVLSTTRSNGKVILSYFDCLPKHMVRQLYFSSELPSVDGYEYYQISDRDVIKGFFNKNKRGREIRHADKGNYILYKQNPDRVKTSFFRLLREALWMSERWKSDALLKWLDEYEPTDIFFVGGDSVFAYTICEYVADRYHSRLSVYLTDDYILKRKTDSLLSLFRRRIVKKSLSSCLKKADRFFTISLQMKETYKDIFGKDSYLVMNMSEPLRNEQIQENEDEISIIYAGSLYYGRIEILRLLAEAIDRINKTAEKKAKLKIYTNIEPSAEELKLLTIPGSSEYCGRLTKSELSAELNKSQILCIVESFDENQIENTRLSLSTKVPEYMSVGKPILAIGPESIGTMTYLSDVAMCVNKKADIEKSVGELIQSRKLQSELGKRAFDKYMKYHLKEQIQAPFIAEVFGED